MAQSKKASKISQWPNKSTDHQKDARQRPKMTYKINYLTP